MELLGYFSALFVGISLGLIGGGGSILAMPILVYIFHFSPQLSTSYSLCIVGISALIGSIKQYKQHNLHLQTTITFGIPSIVSLLLVRKFILPIIPDTIFTIHHFTVTKSIALMTVFAILMIAASVSMIKQKNENEKKHETKPFKFVLVGFSVGIITGLLGAGGGFLIIPALIFFANLSMIQAIGTSLSIIAANALIGFTGDLINHVQLDLQFLFIFTSIAVMGIFIGNYLSKHVDSKKLKPAFGWFVLITGTYIILKELSNL